MPNRYPHDHEKDVIYFAKTNFRNQLRKFGIKTDDRRRHVYVVGKTGMGKTTLLENMILSDIYAGHGACYVDPHGDTAEKIISFIPSWRINDVVYFNPSDVEHPIGFNILESIDPDMKHLVASALMSVFKKIWENVWSARMEYILNNTILALLDTPGSTLLGVNRMLSDKTFRLDIVKNIKDPIVKQFWVTEFAAYDAKFATEAVAPIQNKIGQFLSSSIIRNIVAQAKSSINIREMMDTQKIFIINLSKGRIGEDAMRLLGGMLITKIQVAAMERVNIPEADRQDFYLYVDEFQNFAVESFASILSEARKYRLNLIMAHQYITQLSEEVRDAVFGNVGTMITFRVGSPDAVFMEDEFMPRFTPEDIINLPKAAIYLKLMIDGVSSQPFSAATLPPIAQNTGSMPRVIEQSRERYAGNRAAIEDRVAVWSGFGADVDVEKMINDVTQVKKDAKKAKFSHDYTCTRCGKVFSLPVELDRSRPIYCEDCKPIIDAERQKSKERPAGGRQTPSSGQPVVRKTEGSLSLAALKPAMSPATRPASPSAAPAATRPATFQTTAHAAAPAPVAPAPAPQASAPVAVSSPAGAAPAAPIPAQPEPEASAVPVVQPDHVHELVPTESLSFESPVAAVAAVSIPAPASMATPAAPRSPVVPSAVPSPHQPPRDLATGETVPGADPAKKRKRRRKKKVRDNAAPVAVPLPPLDIPRPVAPTAQIPKPAALTPVAPAGTAVPAQVTSPEPAPTPVMPGERISFED